ncbi:MAG: bifunctional transaldolase/phosoglucose isomerase [Caulobacteraceae bacterium]|nr:bifunctional transaldolase/phosoglucose isomerase [Caulobacteraceae bacterium]
MANPLLQLESLGQSVWLDFVQRDMLENGGLKALIEQDGVTGVTSNPAIFEKAIGGSGDYDAALKAFVGSRDADPAEVFEHLAIADIQAAADLLRPVYDRLNGRDGYVSLEVSPYLALDTEGTLAEARKLWRAVDRPNLMIKVPGTPQGVPAIRALIGEGINVNVTLLFSLDQYRAAAEAHIAGLKDFQAKGGDVSRVAGVASVFVSRIDSAIDPLIEARLKSGEDPLDADLRRWLGQVAIANAKLCYQDYLGRIAQPDWAALAAAGAAPQRLLWASTGTKNPAYRDTLYVETLIGPDTVNTMPPKVMDAFRDHGIAKATLTEDVEQAAKIILFARSDLDLDDATAKLLSDGVRQFVDAADTLYGVVAKRRAETLGSRLNGQHLTASDDIAEAIGTWTETARAKGWSQRLWAGDAGLWTGADEAKWLGWLPAARGERVDIEALEAFSAEIAGAGFIHVLLLGMGGSSLGPEVLAETFGTRPGHPQLLVLDSTDPDQVARVQGLIDPARTLFIVASKSGSTLEPDILHRHFHDLAVKALGAETAGSHFIAITDPGSRMEATAKAQGFRRIFLGDPQIGGRYSVMSNFGMVPAAVAGIDVRAFIDGALVMTRSCAPSAPPAANPGVELGLFLGAAAKAGRDKLTLIATKGLSDVGAWLEQLIAESTGKLGQGIIPIDGEPLLPAARYGADRVFAYLRLDGHDQPELDGHVRDLEEAGHPVARVTLASRDNLGQEFVRWEIATAIAGAVIGIHPFDQPDVEASKIKTRQLTDGYEATGALAPEAPFLEAEGIALFADEANAAELKAIAGDGGLEAYLGAHLRRAGAGDYLALLAYIDRDHRHIAALQTLRARLADKVGVATALGFGPRFLHSTGQAYKGGPASGVFLQITHAVGQDLPVPGRAFSFGVVVAAQARGDLGVLAERGRRHLRIHLGADVDAGLARLIEAAERAL